MYHIFVDLEMQEIERKNKALSNGLKQEVIEFGAVVLDDNMQQVDRFKSYVKPVFSSRKPMTGFLIWENKFPINVVV